MASTPNLIFRAGPTLVPDVPAPLFPAVEPPPELEMDVPDAADVPEPEFSFVNMDSK